MRTSVVVLVLALLSGCGINYVKPVSPADAIGKDRAIIVYGVQVKGQWAYPKFSVQLDEYDAKAGKITGNCLVHTHTNAVIEGTPGNVQYFAFDVPPGQYVYSPFHMTSLIGGSIALEAPAGQHIYVGEFAYEQGNLVSLRQNLAAAQDTIGMLFPELKDSLSAAETSIVKRPGIFICTP